MKDREIFKSAVQALPSLILPLFVTLAGAQLLEYGSTVLCAKIMLPYLTWENPVYFAAVIAGFLLLALFFSLADCLASLGCYRLCLDRGCGKKGTMPWTIFGQWRRYKSWILWMGIVPALWQMGKIFLRFWLVNKMTDMEYHQFSVWKANLAVVMFIASILLLIPLQLSVRTAYLRAPEQGFWYAVFFGIKEGLRKWTKTIGPQLKYVLTVMFAFRMISGYIISPLLSHSGTIGALIVTQGLQMADSIWIMVLYGFLAAERYDPPGRA